MDLKTSATFRTESVYAPDSLIAHMADDLLNKPATIAAGQVLVRGSVLGKVTATGKYLLSVAAATDGSQVPDAVLVQDIDTTAGDLQGIVYTHGSFNFNAFTLGAGQSQATIEDVLRGKGIFLTTVQLA
jgi:hypothetical protein